MCEHVLSGMNISDFHMCPHGQPTRSRSSAATNREVDGSKSFTKKKYIELVEFYREQLFDTHKSMTKTNSVTSSSATCSSAYIDPSIASGTMVCPMLA